MTSRTQVTAIAPAHDARERLQQLGATGLSDRDLVALVIGHGTSGKPVGRLADELLSDANGISGLSDFGFGALKSIAGMGVGKAARLLAAFELGRRVAARPFSPGQRIKTSKDVDAALRTRLAREPREHFIALPLDAKHRLLAESVISIGGLTSCAVNTGDVFRRVVREAAVGVVFVHNHPSGSPKPSTADIELTMRLQKAGELLGIDVIDHVVIGHEGYFSFRDAGLIAR